MINEYLPFQIAGGTGISPDTQRLVAIACALGRDNSENMLFNYKYFTIHGIRMQVQTEACRLSQFLSYAHRNTMV